MYSFWLHYIGSRESIACRLAVEQNEDDHNIAVQLIFWELLAVVPSDKSELCQNLLSQGIVESCCSSLLMLHFETMVKVFSRQRASCSRGGSPHSISVAALVTILLSALLLLAYLIHRVLAFHENSLELVQSPIHAIARDCQQPDYPVLGTASGETICMTTLTDGSKADLWQRMVRWRSFDNILDMTWENKERYCKKYGYALYDESELSLDTSRAPSWSKIKATQRLLTEEPCDWVFWLDADTVIMNSNKRVEEFLPRTDSSINIVVTRQKGTGFNAGAWLIRNTDWSKEFLQRWWDMKQFSRIKGQADAGDNHAFQFLLKNSTFSAGKVGVSGRLSFSVLTARFSRC